jgi:AAA+ ATPase superfamily predicted ATPase
MMQSVSVVGERRIGKSSLLYYIFKTGQQRLGRDVTLAYTDFRDVKDEQGFFECLCRELELEGNELSDLERVIRERKIVFCFDEFEAVMESPAFSREFFNALRSLAQEGNLALVVATEHPLIDLCLTKQIATSPFWNVFTPLDLALFTEEEATQFIHTRFGVAGVKLTEAEIARVLRLAGRFSFFLQLACYRLFEMKVGRAPEWEPNFRQDADDHLRYIWNRLAPSERATLRRVIDYGGRRPDERALKTLARRGLLVRDDQAWYGWGGFSEVFEETVLHPPSLPWRDRIAHLRLAWLKGIEITLWPPGIKIQTERPGEKQRTEDKR